MFKCTFSFYTLCSLNVTNWWVTPHGGLVVAQSGVFFAYEMKVKITFGGKGSFKKTSVLLLSTTSSTIFSEPPSRGFPNFLYRLRSTTKRIIIFLLLCCVMNCNWNICLDIQNVPLNFSQRCMPNHWIVCTSSRDVLLRRRIPFWYSFLLIIITVMRCCKEVLLNISCKCLP